jgi:hypothetical protein
MSEYVTIEEAFKLYETHNLDDIMDRAIVAYEAAALTFAKDAIADANTRQWYMSNIKRVSGTIKIAVVNGEITVQEGAKFCNTLRNAIMEEARVITSVQGRKYAVNKKPSGPSLEDLEKKYSARLFEQKFSELTPNEQKKIYQTIVESAGRDDAKISSGTKSMRVAGKVCIVVTGLLAVRAVYYAENKEKESIKQGAIIGGGAAGGYLGGLAASAVCGPGAWVCAIGWILAGSTAGGFLADATVDSIDEELEEFTKWMAE